MFPTPRFLPRCIKGVGCGMPRFILKVGRMPDPFGWIQQHPVVGIYDILHIYIYIYIDRGTESPTTCITDTHRFKFAKYQRVWKDKNQNTKQHKSIWHRNLKPWKPWLFDMDMPGAHQFEKVSKHKNMTLQGLQPNLLQPNLHIDPENVFYFNGNERNQTSLHNILSFLPPFS